MWLDQQLQINKRGSKQYREKNNTNSNSLNRIHFNKIHKFRTENHVVKLSQNLPNGNEYPSPLELMY